MPPELSERGSISLETSKLGLERFNAYVFPSWPFGRRVPDSARLDLLISTMHTRIAWVHARAGRGINGSLIAAYDIRHHQPRHLGFPGRPMLYVGCPFSVPFYFLVQPARPRRPCSTFC